MHLCTYLVTDVLNTHAETFSIGNHYVDVIVVIISVVGAVVVATRPRLGLNVFEVVPSLEPVESQCRVFAPGQGPSDVLLLLLQEEGVA